MTKQQKTAIFGFEALMVVGIGLSALAVCGYFEPQYSCGVGKTPATTAASIIGVSITLACCYIVYRLNKAAKAEVKAAAEQNPPASTGLA